MAEKSTFWRKNIFTLVIIACSAFVALTVIAMLFYPGGKLTDHNSHGYSFFTNFFSELGLTRSYQGGPNTISAVLFFIALTLAGGGLALFFMAFPQFFTQRRLTRVLSWTGSVFGIIAGICFVGVAFTPANLQREAHGQFVMWAFETFMVAVLLYTAAIFLEPGYPKRYAVVFLVFGFLLILYVYLLLNGPNIQTDNGLVIQATGQKFIVYASIISILIEAYGARQVAQKRFLAKAEQQA